MKKTTMRLAKSNYGWTLSRSQTRNAECPFCGKTAAPGKFYTKDVGPFRYIACADCLPKITRAALACCDKNHWAIV